MKKINVNPKGIKACDCVIRAIAYAEGKEWDEIFKDLCTIGFKMKRIPNEKKVYEKYLEQLGWIKQKQPRKLSNNKYTVNEFCSYIIPGINPDKIIISVANHLTCIENNDNQNYEVVDTGDCGRKSVGNYWVKKENSNV